MKKLLLLITLVAGVIAFALPAQATTLEFSLGTSFPGSDKPDPDGTGPWLNAFFDDKNSANSVYLTLSANLTAPNKVTDWYFNLNPLLDSTELSFAVVDNDSSYLNTAPNAKNIKTGNDKQKADGDGYFDIEFVFPKSQDLFDNSDSITYLITSTEAIWATSFNFQSINNPADISGEGLWGTATHIQSLTTSNRSDPTSTWIGDDTGEVGDGGSSDSAIPEPATMLLLGSGLIGFAVSGKKRFKKRNG